MVLCRLCTNQPLCCKNKSIVITEISDAAVFGIRALELALLNGRGDMDRLKLQNNSGLI